MPRRPGADEPPVPGPAALGVGGRVHADVRRAGADARLERRLLGRVQHVAGREQEHRRRRTGARPAALKTVSSSVAVTSKPFFAPRSRTAWIAAGIESWRKPLGLREDEHARIRGVGGALRRTRPRAGQPRSRASRRVTRRVDRLALQDFLTHRPGGASTADGGLRLRRLALVPAATPPANRKSKPRRGRSMPVVSMKDLLEAGVHFGHQTRRWNPKMKRFIFTERGGIYIIDLQQTQQLLDEAYDVRAQHRRARRHRAVRRHEEAGAGRGRERGGARRHAVRQPPLARRPAHELAHDLRPHPAPARAALAARRRRSSTCCPRRSASR